MGRNLREKMLDFGVQWFLRDIIEHTVCAPVCSGCVSVSDWAEVLESVLRLDLPWCTLRPHLARLAADGSVEYQSCFEDMNPGHPLPQVNAATVHLLGEHL